MVVAGFAFAAVHYGLGRNPKSLGPEQLLESRKYVVCYGRGVQR